VISLAPDCPRERAEYFISTPQAVEHMTEVEARTPAEFLPGTIVDVDTVDTWEHSPVAPAIHLLVLGEQAAKHAWAISAELKKMLRLKRTRRAHDVAVKSDFRSSLGCEDVRLNGIGEVDPSIQVLVHLEIEIVILTPELGVVVRFRKEPRGA